MGPSVRGGTVALVAIAGLALGAGPAPAAAPPNDHSVDAIAIAAPSDTPADTTAATRSATDLRCRGDETHTIWYSFTPRRSGTFGVRVDGNNVVGVATGSPGSLTAISCNTRYQIWKPTFRATAGVRYLIQVAACCSAPGPSTLSLRRVHPFDVVVAVDPTGTVSDGVATITGTITCSHREDLRNTDTEWDPYLAEAYRGFDASCSDYYSIAVCTPAGTRFSFQAFDFYSGIAFGPGTAYFDMPSDVGTCTEFLCARSETDPVGAAVKLQ